MGIGCKFSAGFSKILFLQVALLLLVRNSTCVLDDDNPFELKILNHPRDWQDLRKDATQKLDKPQLTPPGQLFDIGWRITGRSPEELERAKEVDGLSKEGSEASSRKKINFLGEEMSESDRIRDDRFEYQVYKPLLKCLHDTRELQLTGHAENDLRGLLFTMTNTLKDAYTKLPLNVAEHLEHVAAIRAPRAGPIATDNDRLALTIGHSATSNHLLLKSSQDDFVELFFKNTQSALKLLRDPENFTERPSAALSMAFRLNDIFVRLLAALDKYDLISPNYLSSLINEETKGHAIINFILSYFPGLMDATAVGLNYHGFKRNVEMSGFTEEIHNILKYLKSDTWYNIERFYLVVLSRRGDKTLAEVGANFERLTSPHTLERASQAVLEDMITELLNDHTFKHDDKIKYNVDLIHFVVLHHMVSFLVKHHISVGTMAQIKESIFLQAVDEAMALYSHSVKTFYIQYGKLLKTIAGMHPSIDSGNVLKSKIPKYLLDNNEVLPSSPKALKNELPEDLAEFVPKPTSTTRLEEPESSEWKYPNPLVTSKFFLQSKKFNTDHERNNGLQTSPVVKALIDLSQQMMRQFDALYSHTNYRKQSNSHELIGFKSALENILDANGRSPKAGMW